MPWVALDLPQASEAALHLTERPPASWIPLPRALCALAQKSRWFWFSRIYHHNSWWDSESRSGPGSTLKATESIRQRLQGNERRQFVVRDLIQDDLPKVDMVMVRDLFIHLSYRTSSGP